MTIDLREYIVPGLQSGPWLADEATNRRADQLILSTEGDRVVLGGFLRIHVSVQLRNYTFPSRLLPQAGTSATTAPLATGLTTALASGNTGEAVDIPKTTHFSEVDGYVLTIPAGEVWPYIFSQQNVLRELGSNSGYRVVIRLAGIEAPRVPPVRTVGDLPCDFAVADLPHVGRFFPSGCEPCPPDASIGLPPGCGTTLAIPGAAGGCVRPRFFNGMFITREDMEAELLYLRLKLRLHNRAAGQGVVWGLDVGRDGHQVCVLPGYAVDCCGNDLALTTPYTVDIRTLLCDPAAAKLLATCQPQCLHLLLEYVECPEGPRPVHGDPCSPHTTRCEMSRIRETVRLRLVPPRPFDPRGPISAFLDELKALQKDPARPDLLREPLTPAPTPATVPFRCEAMVRRGGADVGLPLQLQPRTDREEGGDLPIGETVTVTVIAHPGYTFSAGDVVQTHDSGTAIVPAPVVATAAPNSTRLEWTWNVRVPAAGAGASAFRFRGWQASHPDGHRISGSTDVQMAVIRGPSLANVSFLIRVAIPPTTVAVVLPAVGPRPCLGEPCCPEHGPLFPTLPPFLHADPFQPAQPADPKVLALAVLYGWLATEAARQQPAATGTGSPALAQAAQVYQTAWQMLFGLAPGADVTRFSETLRRLLAAWCRGFLYPGPCCEGEPHGVVIGCVRIQGGDIVEVDPWGGRRYVLHGPLLEHWGKQIGLAPPDVLVSRLVALICCIADLKLPVFGIPGRTDQIIGTVFLAQQPPEMQGVVFLNNAFVLNAAPQEVEDRLKAMKVEPVRTETLGAVEFTARVVAGLRQPPSSPPAAGVPLVRYTVAGMPHLSLFAP